MFFLQYQNAAVMQTRIGYTANSTEYTIKANTLLKITPVKENCDSNRAEVLLHTVSQKTCAIHIQTAKRRLLHFTR